MKVFLLLSIIGAVVVSETDACGQCPSDHPQQHYCKSDFVVRVEIVKVENVPAKSMNLISALVVDSLKLPRRNEGKTIDIYTPSSFCGTHFVEKGEYVITGSRETDTDGSKYWFHGTCDLARGWRDLSFEQKKGFTKKYAQSCMCKVESSLTASEIKVSTLNIENAYPNARTYWTPTDCYYNPFKSGEFPDIDDCESEYGYCSPESDGKCSWELTTEYEDCFKERDTHVSVTSGDFAVTDPAQCKVLPSKRKRRACRRKVKKYLKSIKDEGGETEIFL